MEHQYDNPGTNTMDSLPPVPDEMVEQLQEQEEAPKEDTYSAPRGAKEEASESAADRNFRELRKKAEAAERERDEMRRYLEELRAQSQQKPAEEEEFNLRPDDIPEWKHVERHIKKLENKLSQYEQQTNLVTTETRLKAQYPDFDVIVNQSNIEMLRDRYPEVADTIASSGDMYKKAVCAYTMIKQLGIGQVTQADVDRDRALKNASKPRPLASVSPQQGDSPLSRANAFADGLTDELKEQLLKEMREAAKYR